MACSTVADGRQPVVKPDAAAVDRFVAEFRERSGYAGTLEAFAFGDSPALADDLAALVRDGPKRATAGWVEDVAAQEDPQPGDHWVVIDGQGQPVAVIATTEVAVRPFADVDPAFAWDEGEGDRTLEDWRAQHLAFFTRRAEALGRPFRPDSPVRLERFRLVHPAPPPPERLGSEEVSVRPLEPDERGWIRHLLGGAVDNPGLHSLAGGFAPDACPGLVARQAGTTVGALMFRPRPGRVDTVAMLVLADDGGPRTAVTAGGGVARGDAATVEAALTAALESLADRYGWGA